MLRFIRDIVSPSSDSFPYRIGQPYPSAWGSWTHYRGTSQDDGTPVSIFCLSGIDANSIHLVTGRNGAKRLRTVKHPNIVSFLFSTEDENSDGLSSTFTIYIVTEAVVPLSEKIKELGLEGQERDLYFSSGLHQIASAVSFLNTGCKLVHGNVCLSSVVVDKNLDWKLHAFDLMFDFVGNNEASTEASTGAVLYERLVAPQYKPMEVLKLERGTIKDPWAIDSWGLGCFIHELFSGTELSTEEELHKTASIPQFLVRDYQNLLSSTPSSRLKASTFVEKSIYFQNKLVSTRCFMETLVVKDRAQKDEFFNSLPELAKQLPPSILRYKILPLIDSSLEYDPRPPALDAQLKIRSMLAPSTSATTDGLEERAEYPAPLVQGFRSCAGPGQDLSAGLSQDTSEMSLSEQQPIQEDQCMHANCSYMIANLESENLRLSNELQASVDARKKLREELTDSITVLKNNITHQKLLVKVGKDGRKAQVEKLVEKIEKLRQQLPTTPICQRCTPVCQRWSPPPIGVRKMNIDASISFTQQRSGGGAVIRESDGQFLCGFSFPIPSPYNNPVTIAEHYALGFAAMRAYEMGFRELMIETDSLNLFLELQMTKARERVEEDSKRSVELVSMPGGFTHCSKASNHLAQNLAQAGLEVDTCVSHNECPAVLYPYWALDLPRDSPFGS